MIAGTQFHGGIFKVKLILPFDYPEAPPKGSWVLRRFLWLVLTLLLQYRLLRHKNLSSKHPPAEWRDLREHIEKRLAAES